MVWYAGSEFEKKERDVDWWDVVFCVLCVYCVVGINAWGRRRGRKGEGF